MTGRPFIDNPAAPAAGSKRTSRPVSTKAPIEGGAPFGSRIALLAALRAAGFEQVYTSDGGKTGTNGWLIPRNTVHRWDSAESIERILNGDRPAAALVQKAKTWIKQRR